MQEYWIDMYIPQLNKQKLQELTKKVFNEVSPTITEYDTFEEENYSPETFISTILEGKGAYLGIYFGKEDGITLGIAKEDNRYKAYLQYLIQYDSTQALRIITQIHSILKPHFTIAYDPDYPTPITHTPNTLPDYFEWFWILGPELAKQYDLSKIPAAFQTKKLQDGGVMILDPNPLDSRITEEDKRKLYRLPKKTQKP